MLNTFLYGISDLPWWGYLVVIVAFTQLTIFGVTLYLHRCQAHRALELHPIVSHIFRFWLWMSTGMVTKEWAAIHRKHHAKVETDEDPHSPIAKGIKKVFFEGAELYREEAKNDETLERYGEGTPNDWIERNLYSRYSALGVTLMAIINLVLFGVVGVAIWAIQMGWIPFFAAGVVNGIGHYWGYRNFESKDASRNIFPWGFFIGGEELHNNHHAFATSAKFSTKWYEFDIGWLVIRMLSVFGLAKPKRVQPRLVYIRSKMHIDGDTLKAVISNRLQILSRYTKEVVLPTLREEKARANAASRSLLKRARTVLTRDDALIGPTQQVKLATLLQNFQSLRTTYQFRVKLQEIWNRRQASQKELVEALQEWCAQAEATGIAVLQQFVGQMKTFMPQA